MNTKLTQIKNEKANNTLKQILAQGENRKFIKQIDSNIAGFLTKKFKLDRALSDTSSNRKAIVIELFTKRLTSDNLKSNQIRKCYNSDKRGFSPNAKITLLAVAKDSDLDINSPPKHLKDNELP
jgi:hypothetical protein